MFGVLLKEGLESKEFMADALHLVELVTANNESEASVAFFKSLYPVFYLRFTSAKSVNVRMDKLLHHLLLLC